MCRYGAAIQEMADSSCVGEGPKRCLPHYCARVVRSPIVRMRADIRLFGKADCDAGSDASWPATVISHQMQTNSWWSAAGRATAALHTAQVAYNKHVPATTHAVKQNTHVSLHAAKMVHRGTVDRSARCRLASSQILLAVADGELYRPLGSAL